MKPTWQSDDGRLQLWLGDCLDTMRELPEESVHCCVTSPPYWGLRDYQVDGQLGLEPTPEEYVAKMVEVFREVRRVLRGDGTLWLNLGDSYASSGSTGHGGWDGNNKNPDGTPRQNRQSGDKWMKTPTAVCGIKPKDLTGIPWRVAFALQADGWYLRQDIIWHKPNPMPESVTDRCTKAHEYIFLLTKSARYWYDAEAVKEAASNDSGFAKQRDKGVDTWQYGRAAGGTGIANHNGIGGTFGDGSTRNRRSVWTVASQPCKLAHFATFPPKLIEPCILAGCPDQCCPECGMGWERVVEAEPYQQRGEYRKHAGESGHNNPTGKTPGSNTRGMPDRNRTTLYHRPACTCNAPDPIPGTVLDPFGGAATTGIVAHQLGRKAILCELSAEYCVMASERLAKATEQGVLF